MVAALSLAVGACGERAPACDDCGTLVIAAVGEPSSVFPPLTFSAVGRDIGDQIFERLAYIEPGAAPIDTAAYRPGLAARWERTDSLTWRFHLRPAAAWHDGQPVTAEDVRFSFEAFTDPTVDALARSSLEGKLSVSVVDASTVDVRFNAVSSEQLYDATYHVRVIPSHIWSELPFDQWGTDTTLGRLIGSGPYRLAEWRRPEFLRLEAVARASAEPPGIPRLIWRFAADPTVALNLVLSHEADLLESVGGPAQVEQLSGDTTFRQIQYPSAVYGFLGFQLAGWREGQGHPVLGERAVRRALTMALDRQAIAHGVLGPETFVPPGPMSALLWIQNDEIAVLPFDTTESRRLLNEAGWVESVGEKVRRRGGARLAFDILVPATSRSRRQAAVAIQEMWRRVGVDASITTVDFPVFQERLREGRFDSYIGAWLDEPSPRGLADQWTKAGWEALNFGRYSNPDFDSLLVAASELSDVERARALWLEAMDVLNADAPAVFLYSPTNIAAVERRLLDVTIDPYSWLSQVSRWRIDPAMTLPRDSVELGE
jgi:peptide/nickel transport system substrate-binding protein